MAWMPKISKAAAENLTISSFSGGLNLRDAPYAVSDGQLTDGVNMWFQGALLQTRPGMVCLPEKTGYIGEFPGGREAEIRSIANSVRMTLKGTEYRLHAYAASYPKENTTRLIPELVCAQGDSIQTGEVELAGADVNILITQAKDDIYFFVSGDETEPAVYRVTSESLTIQRVEQEEYYVPLYLTGCRSNGKDLMSNEELFDNGGATLEGMNLLSDRYRMRYSTVNPALIEQESDTLPMKYTLFSSVSELVGKTVTAVITEPDGSSYTHSVTVSASGWSVEVQHPGDGRYMGVNGARLQFFSSAVSGSVCTVGISDYLEDNLEITIPRKRENAEKKRVFDATVSEWFGGLASGLAKGTRLFLGGNRSEKNLIVWSDLETPLYFPENNYAFLGASGTAVTAFGKQADMLVIFKEDEIYAAEYSAGASVSADAVIGGRVTDLTTQSAVFSITPLHSTVGCDCPATVQLCGNHLVWATSKGKVYVLAESNPYSEKNVYAVSPMIEKRLCACADALRDAVSCEWRDHYLLFAGEKVFALDEKSSGFTYITYSSRQNDTAKNTAWFYWEFPGTVTQVLAFPDKILCAGFEDFVYGGSDFCYRSLSVIQAGNKYDVPLSFSETELAGAPRPMAGKALPVYSMLQTKAFQPISGFVRKKVSSVGLALSADTGGRVKASVFGGEAGRVEEHFLYVSTGSDPDTSFGGCSKRLFLENTGVKRVMLRLEYEGRLVLEALSIQYRRMGEYV